MERAAGDGRAGAADWNYSCGIRGAADQSGFAGDGTASGTGAGLPGCGDPAGDDVIFLLRHPAAPFMRTRRASALQSRTYVLRLLMRGAKCELHSHLKESGCSLHASMTDIHFFTVQVRTAFLDCIKKNTIFSRKVLKNAVPSDILKKL